MLQGYKKKYSIYTCAVYKPSGTWVNSQKHTPAQILFFMHAQSTDFWANVNTVNPLMQRKY